jgi:hypothetical protein
MKGGRQDYPNKGVKIDPRSITSAKMPESLKVYSGYLKPSYNYLMGEGMMKRMHIAKVDQNISKLIPYSISGDALISSYWFRTASHLIEYLRTSEYNYKVYVLQLVYVKVSRFFPDPLI